VEDIREFAQFSVAGLSAQILVSEPGLFLEMFRVAQKVRLSEETHQSEEVQHFFDLFSNHYSHLNCLYPTTLFFLQIHIPFVDCPAHCQDPFGSFDLLENQLYDIFFSCFGASQVLLYKDLERA